MKRLATGLLFTLLQACAESPAPNGDSDGGAGTGGVAGGGGTVAGTAGTAPNGGSNTGGAGITGGTGPAGSAGDSGFGGTAGSAGSDAGGSAGSAGSPEGGAGSGGTSAGSAGTAGGGGTTGGTGGMGATGGGGGGGTATRWVGTWATGQQLTETANNPPAPGLSNNTLRQVVYTSIGGSQLRLLLSNEYGNGAVTMNSVHVAVSTNGSAIDASTDRALRFSGMESVTIAAGATALSDPFDFTLNPQTKLAVTIAFGSVPSNITGHPGSRTTSYIMTGNAVSAASPSAAATTDHWYFITALDVMAPNTAAAVVTLGDSITDGRGSTTNGNDRWPDALSRRLRGNAATAQVAVLNQGIGGNAVVTGGLGPTATSRFDRDVIRQTGVRWVIVLHGVNDIGGASGQTVATNLINAYQQFIQKAHQAGLLIYGVPILPFGESSYASTDHEMARQTVNNWIRTSNSYDAVIDLEAAVRDPMTPTKLLPAYDSGDRLHLSPAGYQKMADAIDLALFTR